MAAPPIVTYGGTNLSATGRLGWSLTSGPEPHTRVLQIPVNEAEQILALRGTPRTLTITPDGFPTLTVENVTVLHETGSIAPFYTGVVVADSRWDWKYKRIKKRYNIRRRLGQRRRLENEGPIEIEDVVDDVSYAPWSLRNEASPWDAESVLRDVFQSFLGKDPIFMARPTNAIPIENLELDDDAPSAIRRVLQFIPGFDMYVNYQGDPVIYHTLDGSERSLINNAGPEVVGGGHPIDADKSAIRPVAVDVYFDSEHELRFDSVIEGGSRQIDEQFLDNVLPCPDPTLKLVGGRTVVAGTWITLEEALAAWALLDDRPPTAVVLTLDIIRESFYFPELFVLNTPWGAEAVDPVWNRRIAAIRSHYRQTYRINRRWVDRIYTIRAYRVSILDFETGTHAPAQVYSDYCIKPNARGIFKDKNLQLMGVNVFGYAALIKDATVSPAVVNVVDSELGIIRVGFVTDPMGAAVEIYPSAVDNIPTADPSDTSKPHTWNTRPLSGGGLPSLSKNHRIAVIITAAKAAPNSKALLYRRRVTPAEAAPLIPGARIEPARGPVWEVRIPAGVETARFAWQDDDKSEIRKAFGVGIPQQEGGGGGRVQGDDSDAAKDARAAADLAAAGVIDDLLVNPEQIDALAKAAAARVYSSLRDRIEGSKTTAVNPTHTPTGALKDITHALGVKGEFLTDYALPMNIADVDIASLMPDDIRRKIFRLVQPNE